MLFGKHTGKGELEIKDNVECIVCVEKKRGASQPNCNHFLCLECFKKYYYGYEKNKPIFPYPEIEYEYYEDSDNSKWKDYPLIIEYWKNFDNYEDNKIFDYDYVSKEHLYKCPLCGK